ncbi:MAG: hypothetical protein K8M05_02330, partial [Deltaproteobacteria bacterium]|nr:hypothetical protein [Kofleriaceae bacterium]
MARPILAAPLLVALLSCGCPTKTAEPTPPPTTTPVAVDASPTSEPVEDAMSNSFVPGPSLSPSEPLLAWLQASAQGGERRLLRLPVVVNFANPGRFSFGVCWIGTEPATPGASPPADAVLLKLDGTGLSVSLVEQVKQKCGDKALSCALWLDGLWGARVEPQRAR